MSNGVPDKRSRRQIVFDWLMAGEEGYWGGAEEVARVDALLASLDQAAPSAKKPIGPQLTADEIQDAFGETEEEKRQRAIARSDGKADS